MSVVTTKVRWSNYGATTPTWFGSSLVPTLVGTGETLSGSITIPAASVVKSSSTGNVLVNSDLSDDVPAAAGTPVRIKLTATLHVPAADVKPDSLSITLGNNGLARVYADMATVPGGSANSLNSTTGELTVKSIPVAVGDNTFTMEFTSTVLPGKVAASIKASLRPVYPSAGTPPTTTADATITGTIVAEVAAEPPAGGGTTTPADVFYRDPADQKFKPLTTLMVSGFPSGPQRPSAPALGTWKWSKTAVYAAGDAHSAGSTGADGNGSLYLSATDSGGTDHKAVLDAVTAGAVVTLAQGDKIVSGVANRGPDMGGSLGLTWTTVGPWIIEVGPVDVWVTGP